MCSYISPTSLFPPTELLSVATVLKEIKNSEIKLIDSIANSFSPDEIKLKIKEFNPNYIVTLIGFETFAYDIDFLKSLKKQFPSIKQIAFGYYPSKFKKEILDNSSIDYVVENEPEGEIFNIINSFSSQTKKEAVPEFSSIQPDLSILDSNNYFEPLMPRPLGVIQTARGCPYTCNFCVKSFGGRLNYKPIDIIINEIKDWLTIGNAKSIRFIDDTFTISKSRVIQICEKIRHNNLKFKWSCLSRIDTLSEDVIKQMADSGCTRIYFGIESGSEEMLKIYSKEFSLITAKNIIKICKKNKIETVGFFMTGLPDETDEDFNKTLNFIADSDFTLVGLGKITLYPGTELFEKYKGQWNFNLFPYRNEFYDKSLNLVFKKRQTIFNRRFYLSKNIFDASMAAIKRPKETLQTVLNAIELKSFIPRLDN